MKVATITYSWAQNWGAVLQAYALVHFLNNNGHDARLINYREFDKKLVSTVKSIGDGIYDLCTIPSSFKRIKRYTEFRENQFCLTKKCITTEELKTLNEEFDAFITGSDQVWNVGLGVCKDFYLEFADESKRRISYAASFGVSSIPQKHIHDTIQGINNITHLSVREKSGVNIIKKLTGRDAKLVLDPVFLLSQDEWRSVASPIKEDNKFIFVYPTQITDKLVEAIRLLKKKTGLDVISPFFIPGCKVRKDIGPREFINYIANAEYIIASSYHATVFSILFQKDFFVIPHNVTGARVIDLLELTGLEKRMVGEVNKISLEKINYYDIQPIINHKIEGSKEFLLNSLR